MQQGEEKPYRAMSRARHLSSNHRREGSPIRRVKRGRFLVLTTSRGLSHPYRRRLRNVANLQLAPEKFESEAAFLEFLQRKAFDYFWLEANAGNGLIRDRSRTNSYCSIAAVGFGLTALGIGIDRGWITRAQGRERALRTLTTFDEKPQGPEAAGTIGHKGWFYHFHHLRSATTRGQIRCRGRRVGDVYEPQQVARISAFGRIQRLP